MQGGIYDVLSNKSGSGVGEVSWLCLQANDLLDHLGHFHKLADHFQRKRPNNLQDCVQFLCDRDDTLCILNLCNILMD